jgi:hypothetical protein
MMTELRQQHIKPSPCFFPTLTKFGASRQFLIEDPSRKFHANKFSGRRGVKCGETDGYDEGNMRFLRLWKSP